MSKKQDKTPEKLNVQLGGMEIYGTTGNTEFAGYKTSGDIENAGKPDKGFKKNDKNGAIASLDSHNIGDD
ncbi:hypothetical protein [Ornithinibacillus bavariensis]|uniref:Uncharacterized protein n=1 Tax=Ornithinibacillus bavariensis TaxID=545502 RepID=A0A919XCD0_9BACI|nr:hypothetical protein [Ornithinibacillus bavariensis]GIO28070.1 hypothetical protein J43TS3_26810 [Ornithinibacillus bavariensis]